MLQRALVCLLNRMHAHGAARIVCRATISSLKEKIDLLSDRVEKCGSDKENIRNSESVIYASFPEYQNLGVMQRNYFRKRYYAQEEYSKMLRVMDRIRQKQKGVENQRAIS